jgi:pre-mRNA-processing factor 6
MGAPCSSTLSGHLTDLLLSREAREQTERKEEEAENPKIMEMLADARDGLPALTEEDWAHLPEVGDLTGKNKRERQARQANQRFYAVPDSVLASARDAGQMETSISATDDTEMGGTTSQPGGPIDFEKLQAAREKRLIIRLNQASEATGAGEAGGVNASKYLAKLENTAIAAGQHNVGDIKRTRTLLRNMIKTNPTNAASWISLARLEEVAGDAGKARQVVMQGTQHCKREEEIWQEAIRLHQEGGDLNARKVANQANQACPSSVDLWLLAIELEPEAAGKKAAARRGLDNLPESAILWKVAANLEEDPEDAKLMLAKAVEFLPINIELWLALIRLEERADPNRARAAINKARRVLPTAPELWLEATNLELKHGDITRAKKVLVMCLDDLKKRSSVMKRTEWISEAERAERQDRPRLAELIISTTYNDLLPKDDTRFATMLKEAEASTTRGAVHTARGMYAVVMHYYRTEPKANQAVIDFYKAHGTLEEYLARLEEAHENCVEENEFWIQHTRELWNHDMRDAARKVIRDAFTKNSNEELFLYGVQLEIDAGEIERARILYRSVRNQAPTTRIFYKSAAFERSLGNLDEAMELLEEALRMYPRTPKLHMIQGQIYEQKGIVANAREVYNAGTRMFPNCIPFWTLASRLEERAGIPIKARSILERARVANPRNEELLLESVRLERRIHNNKATVINTMSKALTECPKSGLLWAERILYLEDRPKRKPLALDAIKRIDNNKHIYLAVARIFWNLRALEKAVNWFEKALAIDPDWGDTWAWYYKLLEKHGTDEKKHEIIGKLVDAEPRHGDVWQRVKKDPANAGKNPEQILHFVVKEMDDPMYKIP